MTILISEYYVDSLLNVAFYQKFLSAEIPIELDTTILDAALLNQLSMNGYEQDQPCITHLYAYD